MNFIFISPHFPHTYWEFCDRLKRNGVNVLGIADAPYDTLSEPLRTALTEYFKVDNLEDYDQVYRAVAFLAFKYGKTMVMCERMPEIFSAAMGNQMYTVKLDRFEDVQDFISFVHAKQSE